MDIPGRVTIITGTSAGIGLITPRRFATAGAKLVLIRALADKLAALAAELRSQGNGTRCLCPPTCAIQRRSIG